MEHRIINNQRGLGYFVDSDAKQRILGDRRKQFVREELPRLFRTMRQLDIGIDELVEYYRQATGDDSDER
jgi:DNA-binding transcriptional regulator YhcF (GntR family)